MALPDIFSPTEPQASEAVATGPAKIQANWQALADFLGIPVNPTQLTGAAFAITSGGVVTISQPGATLAADPTTALGIATKQYVDGKATGLPTGTASGTNTYSVTFAPAPTSLAALKGVPATVTFPNANTGPATLNPNGLGAVAIAKGSAAALASGDIPANSTLIVVYDGTNFNLIGYADATAIQGIGVSATAPVTNQVFQYNGTVWVPASIATVNSFNTVTIGSATINSTGVSMGSIAVTMPAGGGPWRALCQYRMFCHAPVQQIVEAWITDATNAFANASISANAIGSTLGSSSLNATEVSPVTYANSAAVTFTLKAQTNAGTVTGGDVSAATGAKSTLSVSIISGN